MTISRRIILGTSISLPLVSIGRATHATIGPRQSFRIVMLLPYGWTDAASGFRDYLAQRGIMAELIRRDAGGDLSRIAGFVQEINSSPPDLVYISGGAGALEALGTYDAIDPARHITVAPSILNLVVDPAAYRVVRSLSDPGRDVTGIIHVAPARAQLRCLAAYREFRTVATIYNRNNPDADVAVASLRGLLGADGLQLLEYATPIDQRDVTDALTTLVTTARREGADWLYIAPDPWLEARRDILTNAALRAELPSFATTEPFLADAAALVGLVCHRQTAGARAGRLAEQILIEGRRASTLPFTRPDKFAVVIRMETARTLEFYPPMSLLRYADAK